MAEPTPEPNAPRPAAPPPPPDPLAAPPAPAPAVRVAIHALQFAVGVFGLALAGAEPFSSAVAAALVAWIHWLAFLRGWPRAAALGLGILAAVGWAVPGLPPLAVGWVAAAGLAGAAGAWLSTRRAAEEAFFFAVPGVNLAAFALISLAMQRFDAVAWGRMAGGWPAALHDWTVFYLRQAPNAEQIRTQFGFDAMAWAMLLVEVGLWTLLVWIGGRLARRWSGWLDPARASLLLFRLHQPAIFLLICGLALWILGILTGRERAALYAALPLLTVLAIACFLAGLAIVRFYLALRRLTTPPLHYRLTVLAMVAALVLLLAPTVSMLATIGLADVWFDFRRIGAAEQRLSQRR